MIKIKPLILFFILFIISSNGIAQKRYKQDVFSTIDSITNIKYGEATNIKGQKEALLLDIFTPPSIDTVTKRPLVIFIHGGGFKTNSKTGSISAMVCNSFSKKGYVTASIDYRLGIENKEEEKDYHEALYRAQQDGKAAIRFFKKYADKYGIDSSQIFITGTSAGSKTCLAIAYMDENEVPKDIDRQKWGTLEGSSGNEGYSSKVKGVMNNWGALIDYKWIQKGDVPLFNIAGTSDKLVPYDSSFEYHGFKYGPYILFRHCLSLGIPTGWRPFIGAGHTLDNKKNLQDSAVQAMTAWLYTQLALVSKNEKGIQKYEQEINAFDALNSTEKHSDSALLFLGSSYIRMWSTIRQDLHYADIIHRGFGGSNLNDVAYYVDRIIAPHHPKAIFMYVGNDITDTEKDKSPDQVLELFKYTVEKIRERFPTVPITWLKISPSEKRWGAWDKVQAANQLIENYSKTVSNVYTISFYDKFLGADGLPNSQLFINDKLHYNLDGYKVWGAVIEKEVKRIAHSQNN